MPKAKVKTKGYRMPDLKLNITEITPQVTIPPSTPPRPRNIIDLGNIGRSQSETKLRKNQTKDSISKSKQLKEKRKPKPRSKPPAKAPSRNADSNSDDDHPLINRKLLKITNKENASKSPVPEGSNLISSNDSVILHKRLEIDASIETEGIAHNSNTDTQYTSVIKSESVLVIRKHNLPRHTEPSPKKIRLSCDEIKENPIPQLSLDISSNLVKDTEINIAKPGCSPEIIDKSLIESEYNSSLDINNETVVKDSEINNSPKICEQILPRESELDGAKNDCNNDDNIINTQPTEQTDPGNVTTCADSEKIKEDFDSDKTEIYELNASPLSVRESVIKSFSPIPSTSRDNEIFKKNDIRFQESLRVDDDVEIIETPVETIVVEDHSPVGMSETIDITSADTAVDDDIEFVGYATIPKFKPHMIDDILFNTVGMNRDHLNSSDCEIVDVDNVIAESDAILKRFHERRSAIKAITRSNTVADRPVEVESPPTLFTNLDIPTASPMTYIDFLEPVATSATTLSSDPVMASTTSKPADVGTQATTMSGIIGNFFKNNPISGDKSRLENVCGTLGDILDHMTNILGITGAHSDFNTSTANKATEPPRQNVKWMNKYADRFTVVDTVNLDEPNAYIPPPQVVTQYQPVMTTPMCGNMYDIIAQPTQVIVEPPKPPKPPEPDTLGRSMECPICMESLGGGRPLASTICGHIFCMACIQKAVSAPGGKKCPTCRKVFSKKGQSFHPLFL